MVPEAKFGGFGFVFHLFFYGKTSLSFPCSIRKGFGVQSFGLVQTRGCLVPGQL